MKQLVCWVLATLYSIARFNKPTQAEVEAFGLAGWDTPDWFEQEANRASWNNWTKATWGTDLREHFSDSWVDTPGTCQGGYLSSGAPLGLGTPQGNHTLDHALWLVCRGGFPGTGNFLEWVFGDSYCDSIYPPEPPTPTPPAPSPTPATLGQHFEGDKSWNTQFLLATKEDGSAELKVGYGEPFSRLSANLDRAGISNWTFTNLRQADGQVDPKSFVDFVVAGTFALKDGPYEQVTAQVVVNSSSPKLKVLGNFTSLVGSCNYQLKGGYTLVEYNDSVTGFPSELGLQLLVPTWVVEAGYWEVSLTAVFNGKSGINAGFSARVDSFTTSANSLGEDYYTEGTWLTGISYVNVSSTETEFSFPFNQTLDYTGLEGFSGTVSGAPGYPEEEELFWPANSQLTRNGLEVFPSSCRLSEDRTEFSFSFSYLPYTRESDRYKEILNGIASFSFRVDPAGPMGDYTFPEELSSMTSMDWCRNVPLFGISCPSEATSMMRQFSYPDRINHLYLCGSNDDTGAFMPFGIPLVKTRKGKKPNR